jgi:hypothetical protein
MKSFPNMRIFGSNYLRLYGLLFVCFPFANYNLNKKPVSKDNERVPQDSDPGVSHTEILFGEPAHGAVVSGQSRRHHRAFLLLELEGC